jgi:hypothetical protein
MRIWDISPSKLCRQHLLGEHRELHALWIILTTNKKGYRKHPETKRWEGKLAALYKRHEDEVQEMAVRNYHHHSPLDKKYAVGEKTQVRLINTIEEQVLLLKNKGCNCYT